MLRASSVVIIIRCCHSALDRHSRQTWKSDTTGYAAVVVVVVVAIVGAAATAAAAAARAAAVAPHCR